MTDKAVSDLNFKPTTGMASEARKGLEWRKEFKRGGTAVGATRANQLVNRENLSPSTVKRMHSFFSRHEVDKQGKGFSPGEDGYPSAGRIAWALWGGDPGQSWARKMRNAIEREESKMIEDELLTKEDIELLDDLDYFVEDDFEDDYFDDDFEEKVSPKIRTALATKAKDHNKSVGDDKSKKTSTRTLISVFNRGVGAYNTNPGSVRPNVRSPEQWALARVNSFLYVLKNGRFRGGKHDTDLLPSGHPQAGKGKDKKSAVINKIFNLTSRFKALEASDGGVNIKGYASTEDADRAGDIVEKTAWTKSGGLNSYKNNPILLFNHDYNSPIGKTTNLSVTNKGLEIEGRISKSAGKIAEMVKEGILGAFSVGFRVKDADYMEETDGLRIKDAELFEVSVVSVPANQAATFSVTKSFDSEKDYRAWVAQFDSQIEGQSDVDSPMETVKTVNEGTIMSTDNFNIEEFAREVARKTAAEIAMAQAEKSAADEAEAKKAAAEAEVQKAAEQAKLEEKKADIQAVVQGATSGVDRLVADLEKRLVEKQEDASKVIGELRNELLEKSQEIQNMQSSKRVFSDRSNVDWKEKFGPDIDNAMILSKVTGKALDQTKFGQDIINKVNEQSGVQVAHADYENIVSTNIERDIQFELKLVPLFREIAMNAATMRIPIMPDAGYAEFSTSSLTGSANTVDTLTQGVAPHGNLQKRGDTYVSDNTARTGADMTSIVLSVHKLVSLSYLGNETEEDAIMPVLPLIREAMIRSHARAMEHMILSGQASKSPKNPSGAEGASAAKIGPEGLIKYVEDAGSTAMTVNMDGASFAANKLIATDLLEARKKMGKYGTNPRDVIYIVNPTEYMNLLSDSSFHNLDEVGAQAVKLTGQVGQVFGSPVIICDEFVSPAAAAYGAIAVNTRNYLMPRLRGLTVESDYEVANQRRVLVATQRIGFQELIAGAASCVGVQYNAS